MCAYGLTANGEPFKLEQSELFHNNQPLTTKECLDFLLKLPLVDKASLFGFHFNYDPTMILRDLSIYHRQRLLSVGTAHP